MQDFVLQLDLLLTAAGAEDAEKAGAGAGAGAGTGTGLEAPTFIVLDNADRWGWK